MPHNMYRSLSMMRHPAKHRQWQSMRRQFDSNEYSFSGFDKHRCIFIHIPKCAGISVSKTLFGSLGGGHRSIDQYRLIFSRQDFERYFKFTFVRNPWDRLVSAFFYMKQGGFSESDRLWAQHHLGMFDNFSEFVTRWVTPHNVRKVAMFMPQSDFLCTHGIPSVDFVGRFEHLNRDFQHVCQTLNLNCELPKLNERKSNRTDYRNYYCQRTLEIVGDVYREDIKKFGYTFERTALTAQPDAVEPAA